MPPAGGTTLASVQQQVHQLKDQVSELRVSLARLETRNEAVLQAIDELRKDLSEQGDTRPLLPMPTLPTTRLFGLVPGTGKEIAFALVAIASIIAGSGGAALVGGQLGGRAGVEDAVDDEGEP